MTYFEDLTVPNNLGPHSANPTGVTPFQKGKVKGKKAGSDIDAPKEWLIDTGAQLSVVTKSNADLFDLHVQAGSASGTTGGGGILIKTGLTMVFEIIDTDDKSRQVECALSVGVKPNNFGSEILGMDQLATVKGAVDWNPGTRTGRLYKVP